MVMTAQRKRRAEPITPGEFLFTADDFQVIASTLDEVTGIHLPDTKAPLVYSRLAKRLRALRLENFSDYCSLLASPDGDEERNNMIASLTTNVTRFFREGHHFDHLKKISLPPLLEQAKRGRRLRIWSAGCSNGSEPYSIAFCILELMPDAASYDIKILASDIDDRILKDAREGIYDEKFVGEMPVELRNKYMHRTRRGVDEWQVSDEVKKLVSLRNLNLNGPWPMKGPFDIIFCRNVVIYFQEDTQQKIWQRFSSSLAPDGWLFIGHSERVTGPAVSDFGFEGATMYRKKT